MLHFKSIGMKTIQANVLSVYTPSTPVCVQKVKTFSEGYVAYHILQLKCLTLYNPLIFRLGEKVRHGNCADMYNLIELSDLIGFDNDLSHTQDGQTCRRM